MKKKKSKAKLKAKVKAKEKKKLRLKWFQFQEVEVEEEEEEVTSKKLKEKEMEREELKEREQNHLMMLLKWKIATVRQIVHFYSEEDGEYSDECALSVQKIPLLWDLTRLLASDFPVDTAASQNELLNESVLRWKAYLVNGWNSAIEATKLIEKGMKGKMKMAVRMEKMLQVIEATEISPFFLVSFSDRFFLSSFFRFFCC